MRWNRGHKSAHVEDRRRGGGRKGLAVGGIGGIVVLLIGAYLGVDVSALLGDGTQSTGQPVPVSEDSERELFEFVSFVHDDIQKVWQGKWNRRYRPAKLIVYRQGTTTGCGYGKAAMGPFYCPADHNVYIDFGFYQELDSRFGAPGDFAQAYVLAHEIGHHIQSLEGTSARVQRARRSRSKQDANRESVKLELQADCYAGVWAHSAAQRGLLEAGDVEEGLAAAAAIGDDAIQKMSGRRVQPESWTHGSSDQRVKWFRTGMSSGDPARCDTFSR